MDVVLDEIKLGLPGITKNIGCFLFEACIVTLNRHNHDCQGTIIKVSGDTKIDVKLIWENIFDEQMDRAWKNQLEATEHGAECIVVLLTLKLTDFTIIQRSRKGDGFDYWLGYKDDILFQNKARLEISGIYENNNIEVNKRYNVKLKQTEQTDNINLPAFIGIIEFSNPLAKFGKKR
jgi:hypothetical protein